MFDKCLPETDWNRRTMQLKHATRKMDKVFLDITQVDQLEMAATNLRDRLLVRLLFRLGCRVSEALGLRVDDISFVDATITIQHLKTRIRRLCSRCEAQIGSNHSFCPGCGSRIKDPESRPHERRRMRALPVDGDTLQMLRDFIDRGGPVMKNGGLLLFGITRFRVQEGGRTGASGVVRQALGSQG